MGGFGHIKPAKAILEQFEDHGVTGEIYDVFSPDGQPNYNSANFYNAITRSPILLPIWNIFTRHDLLPAWIFAPIHWLEVIQNRSTISRIKAFGDKYSDLIITATHWTPALLAAKAFPTKTIFLYVTDIHPHGLWKIAPRNVHYLVPMEETKIDLTRYGIGSSRITITSFPVRREILKNNHNRFLRRLHNLNKGEPSLIEVLALSGGAGTGRLEILHLLKNFIAPAKANKIRLTLLVSTARLYNDLIFFCAKHQTRKEQIFIDRYTPETLGLAMHKAAILVTKAGGDITFEALAEGLPIYNLRDVGDHERLNRQYLELIGAAKPLFDHHHPWDLIQSDLYSREITLMAKSSHKNGEFHRQASTPKTILHLLKGPVAM